MATTPPLPRPRPRKQPVPLLLESFPTPPTFIPSTPTSASTNPPPSGPPSTPLPPVPGPSRISEYDTLNLLFAASRYSHGGGRESVGSARSSAGYGFSGPASPKMPAGRRASSVVSPVPSLGLDDELPAFGSQRRTRKGRRHNPSNHQANESISEIDFRDILSSVSVMSDDDDDALVPPPSPFPKRPPPASPRTIGAQAAPSPRDSASVPLASPLRRTFEDQQGHNYMASVADLIDPAFAPLSVSERPPITDASTSPAPTSADHPRPDNQHPPVTTSSDHPISPDQDAAALHRQLRSTRSRSASHKQALASKNLPPLDELPPPPSLGALPGPRKPLGETQSRIPSGDGESAVGDTNGGLEPSPSILSTASTSGSLYSVATSSSLSAMTSMSTSSSMTMTTARTSPASVSPNFANTSTAGTFMFEGTKDVADLSKSTITRSKEAFEGSKSMITRSFEGSKSTSTRSSDLFKSTPDLSKSTSSLPSKSMSSLPSKTPSIPPRGTSPPPSRGTSPDIDTILSQTPKPLPRPSRARASDPLSRVPSASAYTGAAGLGQGKRRASDGLLSLGSHSSSAYANPNSTTTVVSVRACSEGSGASLNYRSQRRTTRADRYSSNDEYNEGMRRDVDKEEIERLERALEGYGSGSSDDEGRTGVGIGRRGAGKGGKLGKGRTHGGGGEEGDSDSSLDLHTPLPWVYFFPSSHPFRQN
ncbi:hypothetical protein K443DRAFT_238013 [Laccaria amethystina LaAM-08-1]|uniref:Uncharacterized protein n=1 Tax=Laccaria amethystina LaAM-08-1 TaxID=1095629 RepID=A0A0C9WY27_9AGAR|nr:hypothetical protein K443DRAFT_238013 [Laccaria amethystina LaAM-08-1]